MEVIVLVGSGEEVEVPVAVEVLVVDPLADLLAVAVEVEDLLGSMIELALEDTEEEPLIDMVDCSLLLAEAEYEIEGE